MHTAQSIMYGNVIYFIALIKILFRDNHTSCVTEEVDRLKEVFDERTCLEMLTEYYAVLSNKIL